MPTLHTPAFPSAFTLYERQVYRKEESWPGSVILSA